MFDFVKRFLDSHNQICLDNCSSSTSVSTQSDIFYFPHQLVVNFCFTSHFFQRCCCRNIVFNVVSDFYKFCFNLLVFNNFSLGFVLSSAVTICFSATSASPSDFSKSAIQEVCLSLNFISSYSSIESCLLYYE